MKYKPLYQTHVSDLTRWFTEQRENGARKMLERIITPQSVDYLAKHPSHGWLVARLCHKYVRFVEESWYGGKTRIQLVEGDCDKTTVGGYLAGHVLDEEVLY